LGSVITLINLCVLTFYQMSPVNGKIHNLQTEQYDVSISSLVAKII